MFAVCSGSWAESRQWRKASKLPLICSGLKADPRGDRLCWFGAGPPGGEGPIGWLRSWRARAFGSLELLTHRRRLPTSPHKLPLLGTRRNDLLRLRRPLTLDVHAAPRQGTCCSFRSRLTTQHTCIPASPSLPFSSPNYSWLLRRPPTRQQRVWHSIADGSAGHRKHRIALCSVVSTHPVVAFAPRHTHSPADSFHPMFQDSK